MRKFINLLLCFGLVMSLSACGSAKPKETLTSFFNDYKEQKMESLGQYFTGNTFDVFTKEDSEEENVTDSLTEEQQQDLYDLMTDLDYVIGSETIDGDNAVVKVDVTANNIGEKFGEGFTNAISMAFALAFSDKSEEEINKTITETMLASLKECDKTYKVSVDVHLVKVDNQWLIDSDNNDDLANAITGGLLDILSQLSESE